MQHASSLEPVSRRGLEGEVELQAFLYLLLGQCAQGDQGAEGYSGAVAVYLEKGAPVKDPSDVILEM